MSIALLTKKVVNQFTPDKVVNTTSLNVIARKAEIIALPYRDKKRCCEAIDSIYIDVVDTLDLTKRSKRIKKLRQTLQFSKTISGKMLTVIRKRIPVAKSRLMRWKTCVLKELIQYCNFARIGHSKDNSVDDDEGGGGDSFSVALTNDVMLDADVEDSSSIIMRLDDNDSVGMESIERSASMSVGDDRYDMLLQQYNDNRADDASVGSASIALSVVDSNTTDREELVFTIYSNELLRQIPIKRSKLILLRMKQNLVKSLQVKMNKIITTIAKCDSILVCKSMQHRNPSGCPTCGVIHLGGKTNVTLYVKSMDINTGVESLQPLDVELQYLNREKLLAESTMNELVLDLNQVEYEILHRTTSCIQSWWCAYLALKSVKKEISRRELSLFYYRIRKLVMMKKDIDCIRVQDTSIDLSPLYRKYSNYHDEIREYIAYKLVKSLSKTDKIAFVFLRNLKKAVAKARQWRAQEFANRDMIRKANEQRIHKEKTVRMLKDYRRRVKEMEFESKRWFCTRIECKQRRFLSKDRYNAHMGIHQMSEVGDKDRHMVIERRRIEHDIIEKSFLDRLKASRESPSVLPSIDDVNATMVYDTDAISGSRTGSPISASSISYCREIEWLSLPNIRHISAYVNRPLYYLEVLSKKDSVDCLMKIPLDMPVVRIGTLHDACGNGAIALSPGSMERKLNMVSKIHCMLYIPMGRLRNVDRSIEDSDAASNNDEDSITIVDNTSKYGTYVVSNSNSNSKTQGAMKLSNQLSSAFVLQPGNLICIAVKRDGEQVLSFTEVSNACVVLRFKRGN